MSDNRLKSFVERIAKLHEDRKAIAEDITEVVKEAAGVGYIPKTLRKVVARYLADPAKLAEDDALLETYEAALGRVGKALKAVREGSTWQEASEATGVPRATLARAEAVSKRREMIPEEKGEEAEASTPGAALPLERVESQATTEHSTDAPKPEDGGDGITDAALRADAPLGIPQIAGVIPPAVKPDPESREGSGTHSDDELDIPAHLRGPSPANRRVA